MGQNQNLLRLQRDRKGALRIFIPGPPSATGETAIPSPDMDVDESAGEAGNEGEAGAAEEVPHKPEEEDSQIAVLGFYRRSPDAPPTAEEESLSLAEAVVAEAGNHGKRRGRKPKAPGAPKTPRRRKAPVA